MPTFAIPEDFGTEEGYRAKYTEKDLFDEFTQDENGKDVYKRQEVGEECYIDEHMGFIKFGSRVDVYLPLGTEVCVNMGQLTTGNQTVIAKLK